jgi:hypothetical protein
LISLVRAVVLAYRKLGFARCGGDDARAHRLADLHADSPDAARSAEHEQRLTRFELSAILERVIGRPVREHERRSRHEVHRVGHRNQSIGFVHELLRKAAERARRNHAIARLDALHALAELLTTPATSPPARTAAQA